MKHLVLSVLGMIFGVALIAIQIWIWQFFAVSGPHDTKPNFLGNVILLVWGGFLLGFSYRRFRRLRRQQLQNEPIQPPIPSETMRVIGQFLWFAGHVVAGLSILGTIAMIASLHFNPSGSASGVPLVLGLMLSGILYACGSAFKNG